MIDKTVSMESLPAEYRNALQDRVAEEAPPMKQKPNRPTHYLPPVVPDEEFERIAALMSPYIKRMANKFYVDGMDLDDIKQEALLAINDAMTYYDPKFSLEPFLAMCIRRRLITILKKETSPVNSKRCVSFDKHWGMTSKIRRETDHRRRAFSLGKAFASLTDLEKRIARMYLRGHSYVQIGAMLRIKPKSVDNALCRMKTKMTREERKC